MQLSFALLRFSLFDQSTQLLQRTAHNACPARQMTQPALEIAFAAPCRNALLLAAALTTLPAADCTALLDAAAFESDRIDTNNSRVSDTVQVMKRVGNFYLDDSVVTIICNGVANFGLSSVIFFG